MYDTSFTTERIKETEGDPHTYVIDAKVWDVKPEGTFPKERFYVFAGNAELDPFIITNKKEMQNVYDALYINGEVSGNIKKDVENIPLQYKDRVVALPINYRKDFEDNIIQSLQDIAGTAVAPEGRLFSSRTHYKRCIYTEENPVFTKDEIVISTASDILPQDYVRKDYKPEQPNKRRYIHFDQSLSGDSYGVACTYVDDVLTDNSGLVVLFLKVEWMLRINPPKPPAKIDLAKVRSIIKYFEQEHGIVWGTISYDTFQSAEAMQELEKAGYTVKKRSVDINDEAYLTLCQYMYDERIEFPKHYIFEKELSGLMHYRARHKVDHLPNGCFSIDTKIKLVDGRSLTIKELLEEQQEGKINYVYTINESNRVIEPKVIKKIFKTKNTNDLVKVTLSNGKFFVCTSDHRFMNIDFEWKHAIDLIENELMLPNITEFPNKVVKVERVDTCMDVYDLEIIDNHNFLLDVGVFAHNSKDVSDAVSGSIMNAIEDPNNIQESLLESDLDILFT